nr:hypothetical protein [Marseillevirus cajuinensis]
MKNDEKRNDLSPEERIGLSCNLEKVIYARRLFYWLGYGSTTNREKKTKEEMASRLKTVRSRAKKSRYFQALFGKVPEAEEHTVRWVNNILRKMFDCYISRTSRNKAFEWELIFCSPWKHKGETTPVPKKKALPDLIPTVF